MSDDIERRYRLVDRERSACLCDVGLPGHSVLVAVDPDGEESLWLADEAQLGCPGVDHGNPNQPHEQVGPLPDDLCVSIWWHPCAALNKRGRPCGYWVWGTAGPLCVAHAAEAKAALSGHRCGHPTSTGTPCTRPVPEPGRKCAYHAKHAAAGDRPQDAEAGPGAP